jgi:hypothetical protein
MYCLCNWYRVILVLDSVQVVHQVSYSVVCYVFLLVLC